MNSLSLQNPQWLWLTPVVLAFVIFELFKRKTFRWQNLLRPIWMCLTLLILCDLTKIQSTEWSSPKTLKVFIDRSASVTDVPERRSKVAGFLSELKTSTSDQKIPLEIYSFGSSVQKEQDLNLEQGDLRTLISPLEDLISASDGPSVIVSDGLWVDSIELRNPVFFVGLGEKDEKDLWIEEVQPVFTAFLKNRLKIPFVIGQKGFSGKQVQVSLWRGEEKLEEKNIRLNQDQVEGEFSYFPEKMGEQFFILKIEPVDGELSSINNEIPFRVKVVRDKIRILHIGGKPSVDLKQWRMFLTRQPDVDLVSFYILRSLNDEPEAKNSELSLIPFPYDELFTSELEKFDVVILQNFDFNLYFQPFYLANLTRFVRQGGSLLMIGGDQSFDRYRYSPLEDVFPFTFLSSGSFAETNEKVVAGSSHPVIDGLIGALKLQPWSAYHLIVPRADSVDLAHFTSGVPLLALREVDKGRVAAFNSDESWKLAMNSAIDRGTFAKLGRRLLQYLTFDPEMDQKQLISSRWQVGKPVQLSIIPPKKTHWEIKKLTHAPLSAAFDNQEKVEWYVSDAGLYKVQVEGMNAPSFFETLEQPWTGEWKHLIADREKMKRSAQDSGGQYFDFSDRAKVFAQPLSGRQKLSSVQTPISREMPEVAWSILFLTLVFFFADLYYRKKYLFDL